MGNNHEALWLFIAGQAVMFVCWLLGGGYYMGKILTKFSDATTRLGAAEKQIDRIDKHGTIFSQYNIKTDLDKLTDTIHRVTKLEENARKLDVIVEKINHITHHIENQNSP